MTRADMIEWLQAPSLGAPFGDKLADIAAQLQADGETIAQLRWDLDAGMKAAHDLAFAHHQRQATEIARLTKERDDNEMAAGALLAIHELLDNGGIPRGTFADDHVRNLVALYNQRGETIARLETANAVLHERLEDNRFYDAAGTRIEAEPGSIPDGIECRDDSIKILDENVKRLTAARDAAISALAEEGRKRGEAEAIIADLLRLDHDGSEEEWRAVCVRARAVLRPADGDAT